MSLRERMRLEEIEGDSLLSKPKWFTKESLPVDGTNSNEESIVEDIEPLKE